MLSNLAKNLWPPLICAIMGFLTARYVKDMIAANENIVLIIIFIAWQFICGGYISYRIYKRIDEDKSWKV